MEKGDFACFMKNRRNHLFPSVYEKINILSCHMIRVLDMCSHISGSKEMVKNCTIRLFSIIYVCLQVKLIKENDKNPTVYSYWFKKGYFYKFEYLLSAI